MGVFWWKDGHLLWVDGHIAASEDCCCQALEEFECGGLELCYASPTQSLTMLLEVPADSGTMEAHCVGQSAASPGTPGAYDICQDIIGTTFELYDLSGPGNPPQDCVWNTIWGLECAPTLPAGSSAFWEVTLFGSTGPGPGDYQVYARCRRNWSTGLHEAEYLSVDPIPRNGNGCYILLGSFPLEKVSEFRTPGSTVADNCDDFPDTVTLHVS